MARKCVCACICVCVQEEGEDSLKAKPRELERLGPVLGSRPTSDTDEAVWEELLRAPDSASTGSSASSSGLPQTNTPSSDDDNSRPQESRVRRQT